MSDAIMRAAELSLQRGREFYAATKLRQVATILRLRSDKSADASSSEDYKPLKQKLKCKQMRGGDGVEVEQGEQIVSIRGVEIRFAWGADVLDTDRIQIGSEVFAVVSTDPTRGGSRYLSATCTKVPNE